MIHLSSDKEDIIMKIYILLIVALFVCGCSGLQIDEVTRGGENNEIETRTERVGYTIYAPKVYIHLENQVQAAACKISTFPLPDMDKEHKIRFIGAIGKSDVKVTIKDGWMLEKINVVTDNTEIFQK